MFVKPKQFFIVIGILLLLLIVVGFIVKGKTTSDINDYAIAAVGNSVYIPNRKADKKYDLNQGWDSAEGQKYCLSETELESAVSYIENKNIWHCASELSTLDFDLLKNWRTVIQGIPDLTVQITDDQSCFYCVYDVYNKKYIKADKMQNNRVYVFILDIQSSTYYFFHYSE